MIKERVFPLLLIAAALIAYSNSFSGVFIFDDGSAIVENEWIRRLGSPWLILLNVRPFLNFTLALNYALGGLNVWGYHAVNLLIHILAGLTLFGIVRRTLPLTLSLSPLGRGEKQSSLPSPPWGERVEVREETWLAFTISLLWLVHPLQTQSVTYIIQRAESLMGLFYLLTLYCVIRGWHLAAIVSLILGMETKEVMITAPFVILLYDRIFLASSWKEVFKKRWVFYLGLLASLGLSLWKAVVFYYRDYRGIAEPTAGFALKEVAPLQYALTQPGVLLHYLRLAFWPHPLVLDYYWPVANNLETILLPGAVIGLLLGVTLLALRYRPQIGFLGAWFFLILAPTSSIMPIADLAFEHRMYLPLASVITLAVLGTESLLRHLVKSPPLRQGTAGGVVLLMTVTLSALTIERNKVYHDEIGIWLDTISKRPQNPRPYRYIGLILTHQGELEAALAYYSKAVQLDPADYRWHSNLGIVLMRLKRYDEALNHYREALRLKPNSPELYNNIGNAFREKRDFKQALRHYRKALRLRADSAELHHPIDIALHNNIGLVLLAEGKTEGAIRHFQETLKLAPGLAPAYNNLGLALMKQGKLEEAVRHFREAIRLDPNFSDPRKNLARILKNQKE